MTIFAIIGLVVSACATSPLWRHRPTPGTVLFSAAYVLPWLVLLIIAGCASLPRPVLAPDDQRAVEAFRVAWAGAGLPSLDGCQIERTRVLHTQTREEFVRECRAYPEDVAECVSQYTVGQVGLRVVKAPLIVLKPGQLSVDDVGGGPVNHGLIHAASTCTHARGGPGVRDMDATHQEPRFWEAASKDPAVRAASVQGRARELLSE